MLVVSLHVQSILPVTQATCLRPTSRLQDVLCNMSGIFRDSFQNVVDLLDDLFVRAASADEPAEQNYIRKHAGSMQEQGLGNATARLFSNPAGAPLPVLTSLQSG